MLIFAPPMICNIVKYQSEVRPEVRPSQPPVIISCQHFLILSMVLISCVHHLPSSSQYYSHTPQNLVVVQHCRRSLRFYFGKPCQPDPSTVDRLISQQGLWTPWETDLSCGCCSALLQTSGSQQQRSHFTPLISAIIEITVWGLNADAH